MNPARSTTAPPCDEEPTTAGDKKNALPVDDAVEGGFLYPIVAKANPSCEASILPDLAKVSSLAAAITIRPKHTTLYFPLGLWQTQQYEPIENRRPSRATTLFKMWRVETTNPGELQEGIYMSLRVVWDL